MDLRARLATLIAVRVVVSTLLLGSPKVGLLRRGRYVKGKRVGKGNAVEEGAEVKKGQVLG